VRRGRGLAFASFRRGRPRAPRQNKRPAARHESGLGVRDELCEAPGSRLDYCAVCLHVGSKQGVGGEAVGVPEWLARWAAESPTAATTGYASNNKL
jgi:hypothetical protein